MVSYKVHLYRCTLYDTIFYKHEDDPMWSKHVALLIVALFNFAPLCCVRRTIEYNRCTLYDTIFYKPEDDPMGSKHVALLIVALFNFASLCCVRRTIFNEIA